MRLELTPKSTIARVVASSLLLIILVMVTLTTGCGLGSAQPGRIPSPDWSRGIPLSSDVGGTVGMAVLGDAESVHFVWPTAMDDQAHIHYVQLDGAGEIVADHDLDLPEGRVRSPRLVYSEDGMLHLLWGSRTAGSRYWELWHARLDETGQVSGRPTQISQPDQRVGSIVSAQRDGGGGFVVWEEDASGGLMGAVVSDSGTGEPVTLVESGSVPGIAVGNDGSIHLAWFEQFAIRYAQFSEGDLEATAGDVIAVLGDYSSNTVDGPAINVVGDQVYVAWSIFANVGLESGSARTEYVSFAASNPERTPSTKIWLLPDEDQPYHPYAGGYALTVLADPVESPILTTNIIMEPSAGGAQGSELAMVVSAMQDQRLDGYVQMVLVLFEDGQFSGYQLAGKTESLSHEGLLATDTSGDLHLAWREGTGIKVYYATTDSKIQSGIDRLGGADLASVALGGGLDAITGALFFPLALIWFIPGMVLLGIWQIRRDGETIADRASQMLAIIAIILYQISKALFMPSIVSYIPFSAWLDIPERMQLFVQVAVPAVILVVGIVVAEIVRRRRDNLSALLYFLVACGVDALLTLGVYGVGYLGYL